jgi:hypothetical protein
VHGDLELTRGYVILAAAPERRMQMPVIEIVPWPEVVAGRLDLGLPAR